MKFIYLDSRFWIDIGDNVLNGNRNESISNFYALLKELVYTKKVICPISNPIFLELFKQKDVVQKKCIAKIMDELSNGYCMESKYYLFKNEICNIYKKNKINNWVSTIELRDLYETKITELPKWNYIEDKLPKIEEIVNIIDVGNWNEFELRIEGINEYLQEQKKIHESEILKFNILQILEIATTFKTVCDIFPELKDEIEKLNAIPDLTELHKKFPSIWAFGSIHALLRYDKSRKYRVNDYFDIDHCSMAIGYFDLLFTERSFYHIVTDKLAELDNTFNTVCCKNYDEGNIILHALLSSV